MSVVIYWGDKDGQFDTGSEKEKYAAYPFRQYENRNNTEESTMG